jgi:hypothetical protein
MPRHARNRSFALAAIVAFALVATGCGSAGEQVAPTEAPVPPSPAITSPMISAAPTSASATPGPESSAFVVADLPASGAEVFPGRYLTRIEPALMLTIDHEVDLECAAGHRCRGDVNVNEPGWLDLEFGHDRPVELFVMTFDEVADPMHPKKFITPPSDLAAWISALPGVSVSAQKAVVVDGEQATQLDLATDRDVTLGRAHGIADLSTLGYGAHQLWRVTVVRRDGSAVVIALGSLEPGQDPARLARSADILQPIVDSMSWR